MIEIAARVAPWLGGSAILTTFTTQGCRRLATRTGFVAAPNPIVAAHTRAVPYLGGLAILGAAVPICVVAGLAASTGYSGLPASLLLFAGCMLALGTIDDFHPLEPAGKFLAQVAICVAFIFASEGIHPVDAIGKLAFLLVLVNAFNLIDVMDGLLIVVSLVSIAGLAMGGLLAASDGLGAGVLAAALIVAFAFNRPPARIYLGDGGALALGSLLGGMYLRGPGSTPHAELLGLAVFAVPLLELSLLVVARSHRGLSPFRGSSDHFALRLQDRAGWSTVKILAVTVLFGLLFDLPLVLSGPARALSLAAAFTSATVAWISCWRLGSTTIVWEPNGSA
jgi:UDP-GlcNAc:undecaprenyl-phosphate GlcNAc-1-phosphate transferase